MAPPDLAAQQDDAAVWLPLEANIASLAGGWVEIVYEASLFDRLERPALRWRGGGEEELTFGAAPAFGRGAWIGRAPDFAREAAISPLREGMVRFRVVRIARLASAAVFARALRLRPGLGLLALRAALTGDPARAQSRLRAALAARPLADAASWMAARRRPFEPEGLDRPTPGRAPRLRLIVEEAPAAGGVRLPGDLCDLSFRRIGADEPTLAALADLDEDDLVGAPGAGALAAEAPAILREAALASAADLFYVDEADARDGTPRLKPDWSPILAESLDLFGHAWFARAGWLRRRLDAGACGPPRAPAPGPDDRVEHIRRVLLSASRRALAPARPCAAAPALPRGGPSATLIIPTRDRADLLSACLASLPRDESLEIVIVDNGGVEPRARGLLEDAARDRRVVVRRDEGPFNFSRLCNNAAATAHAPLLVFLNDDVEARDEAWLAALASWAMRPDIGAVGARLLYPDGRLQHGGVTLGVGGRAAHYERLLGGDEPGYFGRLNAAHEVSAVTGACLAVETQKFHAVGGFDAERLPVDLNDVDLCLRLAERGWRCVLAPQATLVHRESATRGDGRGQPQRYGAEIAWFRRRWARQLGDDPYFHPSLSLDTAHPALD